MADLKERIKVWKDYINDNHNKSIKESLEGVDDEDLNEQAFAQRNPCRNYCY